MWDNQKLRQACGVDSRVEFRAPKISCCLGWSDITFHSLSMSEYISIGSHFQTSRVYGHFPDEAESDLCRQGFPPSS